MAHFVGAHLVIERQTVALAPDQLYWLDVALLETATAPTAQTSAALYRSEFLERVLCPRGVGDAQEEGYQNMATKIWLPKHGPDYYQQFGCRGQWEEALKL